MLKGLEIQIVNLSTTYQNKDFRIDSDFYTKAPKINPNIKYITIGSILKSSQYGISIEMNSENNGFPIYRMNEIHNMFCDFDVDKCADISRSEFKKFELNDRDVLFNRTNSFEWVGRTGIYRKQENKNFVFASYLVRFVPDEQIILPEYLTTFLNSKFGIWDVKRRARHSINQTNVNPEEVKAILIPALSLPFQYKLKEFFDTAYINFKNSEDLYNQANSLLEKFIGLKNNEIDKNPVNEKSFKSSFLISGRLDAEYYQKKYEKIVSLITSQKHQKLIEIVEISKSIEPGSAFYSDDDYGLPFYRVSDYNKLGLSKPDKNLKESFLNDNKEIIKKLMPKKGTVLFSKDGSVGTAYLLRENLYGITSGAILHLKIKDKNKITPEYLTLVLNSKLVKMQAERDAGGSIILHWRKEEIENVVIPVIAYEKQHQLTELVEESFRLKTESEKLLGVAKKAVEIAIELGENQAVNFINRNNNG